MRPITLLLTGLGILGGSLAAADEPARSSATAAAPAQSAPAAAPVTAKETPAAAPAAPAMVNGVPVEHEKQIRAMGYVPELRHGDVYYCRKEAQLGTRFETKTCRTAVEIERLMLDSRSTIDRAQREQFTPTGH